MLWCGVVWRGVVWCDNHDRGKNYRLEFVKNAVAYTDVPIKLDKLLKQRRRWLNGSFFAMLHALTHFTKIFKATSHPCGRKVGVCSAGAPLITMQGWRLGIRVRRVTHFHAAIRSPPLLYRCCCSCAQALLAFELVYFIINVCVTWFLIGSFYLIFKLVRVHLFFLPLCLSHCCGVAHSGVPPLSLSPRVRFC